MPLFHYHAETTKGPVPVAAVAEQLRIIAKIIEESRVSTVTFTLEINEASKP
jgi:hypothetical protein